MCESSVAGSGQGNKGKAPAGPSGQQHRAGTGKAASSIEAALQCEEDLAEDAAASPGIVNFFSFRTLAGQEQLCMC